MKEVIVDGVRYIPESVAISLGMRVIVDLSEGKDSKKVIEQVSKEMRRITNSR